jgi:hypothetical protein
VCVQVISERKENKKRDEGTKRGYVENNMNKYNTQQDICEK